MNVLYLIPARGGSKGIPNKNIKELNGKPLIYYSIEIARCFAEDNDICVSTDSPIIAEKVEEYGLKVPFIRPDHLATDTAGTYEMLLHSLEFYGVKGIFYDCLVLLQPTSPFRKETHLREAWALYNSGIEMVVSVKESKANPYFTLFEESKKGFLQPSKHGNFIRRQDCPKIWQYNGAIYIMNAKALKKRSFLRFTKIKKYVMDDLSSLDLDNIIDWKFGEFLLNNNYIKSYE